MRFTCFCLKQGENRLDFVYKRLKVELLAPKNDFGGLGVKEPKHVDGIKANNCSVFRANVLVRMIVSL